MKTTTSKKQSTLIFQAIGRASDEVSGTSHGKIKQYLFVRDDDPDKDIDTKHYKAIHEARAKAWDALGKLENVVMDAVIETYNSGIQKRIITHYRDNTMIEYTEIQRRADIKKPKALTGEQWLEMHKRGFITARTTRVSDEMTGHFLEYLRTVK